MGPGGACYESMAAQYRHGQVVDAVKAVLVDAGASLPVEELRRRLAKERHLEAAPEFLRRCVEVSRELGFERGGSVGLRRWEHFDAHDLPGMAHAALAALGEVSSTEDIARKMIEELYPWRAPGRVKRRELVQAALERGFKLGSVSATLLAHKELFRRCGRGEWAAAPRPDAP